MYAVTIDIDWAPDWMVEDSIDLLESANVKATFFITHASPVLERLRARPDLFELGIHPNFLAGSSQGISVDGILEHLKRIVPESVSMRTHSLYQTTPMLCRANEGFGIKNDVSLFLQYCDIAFKSVFLYQGARLNRLLYNWEDDFEFYSCRPSWHFQDLPPVKGWIFDFHPVHLALNSANQNNYIALRKLSPAPQGWTRDIINKYRNPGVGAQTMFSSILAIRPNCEKICEISEMTQTGISG